MFDVMENGYRFKVLDLEQDEYLFSVSREGYSLWTKFHGTTSWGKYAVFKDKRFPAVFEYKDDIAVCVSNIGIGEPFYTGKYGLQELTDEQMTVCHELGVILRAFIKKTYKNFIDGETYCKESHKTACTVVKTRNIINRYNGQRKMSW